MSSSLSLGQLSSESRDGAIAADIDYCRGILFKAVAHTDLRPSIIAAIDFRLQASTTLDAIRKAIHGGLDGTSKVIAVGNLGNNQLGATAKLQANALEYSDAAVLHEAGKSVLESNHNAVVIGVQQILDSLKDAGLNEDQVRDSLEVLDARGFITGNGRFSQFFQLSNWTAPLWVFHLS